MNSRLLPLNDRLVVKQETARDRSEGGVLLPEQAQQPPTRGTVLSVGPGGMTANGDRIPMAVEVGDVVFYATYAGDRVELDNETFVIIREGDILAKVVTE